MKKFDEKLKSNAHEYSVLENRDFEKKVVNEVIKDFEKRQTERKSFEAQWQLNMNFLMGNQYCSVGLSGGVEEFEKQYFWQERQVFNHIAPLVDVRLAKLQKIRPNMNVVPASGDENDLKTAKISKKILDVINSSKELSEKISQATRWSEVCGTSFYKIVWNSSLGQQIINSDLASKTGDVEISVVSPFEIFPESSNTEKLEDNQSIIHAKAYHIDQIKNIWGLDVDGEEINVFSLDQTNKTLGGLEYNAFATKMIKSTRENYAIVIEKYELPSTEFPNGRLVIVCGENLLYIGDLPFVNQSDGKRTFPFVKQTSLEQIGCFWGNSVIERIIPIQRAYNTIKNRKHEFLNRLSMGVLTVEDGSVDIENLEEEGLSPGKVVVYRQGSTPPNYMSNTSVPLDFQREEEKLLNEIMLVSGTSDILRDSSAYSANLSGVALQLLIEQDESRLTNTSERVKESIKLIAQHILRLYKQFALVPKLNKIVGNNGEVEVFYFSSSDITSDEVVFEAQSEITETLAQRRSMVFDLLNAGLLQDENGKLSNRMRVKALELLGFGIWENSQDINELHTKRASNENLQIFEGEQVEVLEIDDHPLHIAEHTAYMIGSDFLKKAGKKIKEDFLKHIRAHKKMQDFENMLNASNPSNQSPK
jgi:hypothetical protein